MMDSYNESEKMRGLSAKGPAAFTDAVEVPGAISEPAPSPGCGLNASTTRETSSWPHSCRYFVPEVMDSQGPLKLNLDDSKYLEERQDVTQSLEYIDLGTCPSVLKRTEFTSSDATKLKQLLGLSNLADRGTRIIFLSVQRFYAMPRTTYCLFGVTKQTWQQILTLAMVPPNAVELIHDKSGGYWSCNTYCSDNSVSIGDTKLEDKPCAYHIMIRLCTWLGNEHSVYARHDFHTGKNLLLIAGSGRSAEVTQLLSYYQRQRSPHLFSTLSAITTTWLNEVTTIGMDLDFATQRLESETGFSNRLFRKQPLPPEQLSLRKGIIATRENLHGACRASDIMRDVFTFLDSELSDGGEFYHGREQLQLSPDEARVSHMERQLTRQFKQRKIQSVSLSAQIQQLIRRVDTQWQITTALISRHNAELTMQMAKDSRNDSILMRRIAFVTIIFLPATFLSTFFSMSFFHISGGSFTVSKWIWLYVACTAPLTLMLSIGYGDVLQKSQDWYKKWRLSQRKNMQRSTFEAAEPTADVK